MRPFTDASEDKSATRAVQLYQILIGYAARRQTVTYLELAKLIGWGSGRPLNRPLGYIMFWCEAKKLPPLTALVVDASTGLPGIGFTSAAGMFRRAQQKIFKQDWYAFFVPTVKQLIVAHP